MYAPVISIYLYFKDTEIALQMDRMVYHTNSKHKKSGVDKLLNKLYTML